MPETQEYWFAARTRKNQELAIRDTLQKLNVEHFLPTQTVIRELRNRRKKVEVPVIRNLLFIRATREKALSLLNDYAVQIFYIQDYITRKMLIIPEKQMEDFMFVMDLSPDKITFDDDALKLGSRVQVVKGEFCGVEGELASFANRSYVMIRIPQVLSVSVRIPKSYLKIIG